MIVSPRRIAREVCTIASVFESDENNHNDDSAPMSTRTRPMAISGTRLRCRRSSSRSSGDVTTGCDTPTLDLDKEDANRCFTVTPLIAINPPMVRCVFFPSEAENYLDLQIG